MSVVQTCIAFDWHTKVGVYTYPMSAGLNGVVWPSVHVACALDASVVATLPSTTKSAPHVPVHQPAIVACTEAQKSVSQSSNR